MDSCDLCSGIQISLHKSFSCIMISIHHYLHSPSLTIPPPLDHNCDLHDYPHPIPSHPIPSTCEICDTRKSALNSEKADPCNGRRRFANHQNTGKTTACTGDTRFGGMVGVIAVVGGGDGGGGSVRCRGL